MKVVKNKEDHGIRISFQEDRKKFDMIFAGNGDLYFVFLALEDMDEYSFTITKENYEVYRLFEQLFDDIENINIFNYEIPFYLDKDEIEDYVKEKEEEIEEDKRYYRLSKGSIYNELFNKENDTITWYSDETAHEVSNILKIRRMNDSFRFDFYIQEHKKEYDRDFNSTNYIPIRFRNSGSHYHPFNILFMKLYNAMQEVDDVNDYGHQMHIEEFLYEKKKVKKK